MSLRRIVPLFGLLLAACPESVGSQCPPNSSSIGQFSLAFTGQHDAGNECYEPPAGDAGTRYLTLDNAGTSAAALCLGTAKDGGAQIWLVLPGKTARSSDLLPDGGFHFTGHTDAVSGICNTLADAGNATCGIAVDEAIDGVLYSGSADAGFALQPDGGVPAVTGLTGSLIDHLTSPAAANCLCNAPCTVTYNIVGSSF